MALININKRKEWVEKWQHKNTRHKTYNAGIISYGTLERKKVAGKTVGREFKPIDKYPFRTSKVREQDKEFAHGMDKKIDIKMAIPYNEKIESDHVINLRGTIYNIITMDRDILQNEVFLTLQKNENE